MTEKSNDAHPLEPEEDNVFGPLNRLVQPLKDHDERGLILSLAAFAEDALGKLLGAFLRPTQTSRDLLTGSTHLSAPSPRVSKRARRWV